MRPKFFGWALVLNLSLVAMGLGLRVLALHDVPVSESLILRGLSCLAVVVLFARRQKLSLKPKVLKTQVLRAGLAGLALTFLSLSYNGLTASSVSVLSNIDVPFLVVLGPLIGVPASRLSRLLSVASISFLVWYISGLEGQPNLLYGLSSLAIGSLLLCFGYLFIKKSMAEENKAVAILTPALAIVFYGLVETTYQGGRISVNWTSADVALCVLSGFSMFVAYIATMKLYELTDLASAEFPTLISAIVIQPAEFLFLHEPLKKIYLVSAIAFVFTTYFIMNMQKTEGAVRVDLSQ
jgi:drug/metabolite transporter (DMT)-like permease